MAALTIFEATQASMSKMNENFCTMGTSIKMHANAQAAGPHKEITDSLGEIYSIY